MLRFSLYEFVLTSFVMCAIMAFKPKTWKEIPRVLRAHAAERRQPKAVQAFRAKKRAAG